MRISDWISDVCSSDLPADFVQRSFFLFLLASWRDRRYACAKKYAREWAFTVISHPRTFALGDHGANFQSTLPRWPRAARRCTAAPRNNRLQRVAIQLAGADAYHPLQAVHEDLAVADLAGVAGLHDRLDHEIHLIAGNRHFQLDLGQKIDHVLGPPIQLGVAFLPTKALDLGDRKSTRLNSSHSCAYHMPSSA